MIQQAESDACRIMQPHDSTSRIGRSQDNSFNSMFHPAESDARRIMQPRDSTSESDACRIMQPLTYTFDSTYRLYQRNQTLAG